MIHIRISNLEKFVQILVRSGWAHNIWFSQHVAKNHYNNIIGISGDLDFLK